MNDSALQPTHRSPKLARNLKDLYAVWKEFEFGVNGQKAAKDYTAKERGDNKFMYCRRKVFWDAVTLLLKRGYTSDTAIDCIYTVYGRGKSNTQILNLIKKVRKDEVDRL